MRYRTRSGLASIADPTACDRFALREVRGIDPGRPTPLRMKIRLARAGMRSVSLAVDVTNYLMLEVGQPLHAFDAGRLSGPIVVRPGGAGERLETLDHVLRDLDPEDILITDSSGPISLAGTMGGVSTEITPDSRDLVIEAAHFSAQATARMSRRHRLFSEASARFERGVDYELPLRASAKAAVLLAGLGGGTMVPGAPSPAPVPEVSIAVAADYPDKVAGVAVRARHGHLAAAPGGLLGHRRDGGGRAGPADRRPAVLAARPDRPGRPGRGGHPAGGLSEHPGLPAARGWPGAA